MHDIGECIKADFAETYVGMAILGSTAYIFAVINVKDGNLIFSDQAVELIDHIIEMVDDIISAVTGMAGVKADSQLVIVYNASDKSVQALQMCGRFRNLFRPWFPVRYDREYLLSGQS